MAHGMRIFASMLNPQQTKICWPVISNSCSLKYWPPFLLPICKFKSRKRSNRKKRGGGFNPFETWKLDHIESKFQPAYIVKLDQIGSNWIKLDQNFNHFFPRSPGPKIPKKIGETINQKNLQRTGLPYLQSSHMLHWCCRWLSLGSGEIWRGTVLMNMFQVQLVFQHCQMDSKKNIYRQHQMYIIYIYIYTCTHHYTNF